MREADKRMYYIVSPNSFAYNPARINVGSIGYQNIGKNVTENLITTKIGNKMFGRNLGNSLDLTMLDISVNSGLDKFEDIKRKK